MPGPGILRRPRPKGSWRVHVDPIQASWRKKGYLEPRETLVQQIFPRHCVWGYQGRRKPLTEVQSSRSTFLGIVKQQNKAAVMQTPGVVGTSSERDQVWGYLVRSQQPEKISSPTSQLPQLEKRVVS